MKALSVLCIIASLITVWSESTFQISGVTLSIPQIMLSNAVSYAALEFVSIVFVLFMCTCTYSTLLGIKVFDFYQMIPGRNTDEVSLLFVGAYLSKLTFPIIYNFLNMCGLADAGSYDSAPAFIQYLGPAVNLTPLFGSRYNDWVAHLILITCVLVLFNLHGRIMKLFSSGNYFYEQINGNSDSTEGKELLEQGIQLLI